MEFHLHSRNMEMSWSHITVGQEVQLFNLWKQQQVWLPPFFPKLYHLSFITCFCIPFFVCSYAFNVFYFIVVSRDSLLKTISSITSFFFSNF